MNTKNQDSKHQFNIAYVVSTFPAPAETYLFNQLAALIEYGHHVTIFSTGKPKILIQHRIISQYNLISKTIYKPFVPRSKPRRLLKALMLLSKNIFDAPTLLKTLNIFRYGRYAANLDFFYDTVPFLQKKEFDIVHCHFGPNGIKAVNFRELNLLKGKLLTSFHGYDVNQKDYLNWSSHYGRKGLYKDLISHCDLFTVNSHYTATKAVSLGIPETKITLLPTGIDTTFLHKEEKAVKGVHPPTLLTVARLVEFKGMPYSIRAAKKLLNEFPDLHYHIIGEGEMREEIEQLIHSLKLSAYITLHGPATQEKIREFYSKAHVFVLSGVVASDSEVEAQGLVIQEAQSMQLPVVVSNAGGAPEGMIDNETGFVVPPKDVDALAGKIKTLLQNPGLCKSMGEAGRAFVQQHYDTRVLNAKLVQLYTTLYFRI